MCTSIKQNTIVCECGNPLGKVREIPVSHFSNCCCHETKKMIYWGRNNLTYLCGSKTLICCGACGYKYTVDNYSEYDEAPVLEKAWLAEISEKIGEFL